VSQPLPPECPFFPPYTPRGGWSEDCWSDKAWKEAVGAKCYVFPLRDCGRLIADLTALQPWSGHLLFQWIGESFQLRLCGPVDRTLVQPLIARATETMAQFTGGLFLSARVGWSVPDRRSASVCGLGPVTGALAAASEANKAGSGAGA